MKYSEITNIPVGGSNQGKNTEQSSSYRHQTLLLLRSTKLELLHSKINKNSYNPGGRWVILRLSVGSLTLCFLFIWARCSVIRHGTRRSGEGARWIRVGCLI